MQLATRAVILQPSPLQEFFKKAKTVEGAISLEVGETNFQTPSFIKEKGIEAIKNNFTGYTPASGIADLRKAAVVDFQRSGISSASFNNTIIGPGAKPLIAASLWALCNPEDEILIPGPYYPPFWDLVKDLGAKPVLVDTSKDGFILRGQRIKELITSNTRGIILNSPNNPTGMIWDWAELKDLDQHLWVVTDESYCNIVFGGRCVSIASLPNMAERTITIRSCSKSFVMTGWRIGYLMGSEEVVGKIQLYLEMAVGCPCAISQKAATAILDNDTEKFMIETLDQRRQLLMSWLDKRDIPYPKPMGAFYVFPDFSRYEMPSMSLANLLLDQTKVAVTPGIAFGPYNNFLRISYAAVSIDTLKEALDRIDKTLKALAAPKMF
ncbi:aminotransferase class I/II-fold pyridoxal phosphate-dependent enzyme [Patescibacteria group bacterium]|nr:aminotransferase class I/II-fold pyridoxal phosphate-dependent enzyme [Patescibacteria group bacterium]MBU4367394.1 aminotransferase class I/II-fold pyridoxal phosphate-dependent enzyme [Patescibacteria group bacterium]MBU4461715.1 aminotransferase class I/II-fold pyridoxal phosphate-dependent enzyme [Patescibacteria group bacterium]MCG2700098.1 aminotransferase class I/II-fold pyridoxal phosphate-dependent enzyme [Candidatus Parcubacteria bacterium]